MEDPPKHPEVAAIFSRLLAELNLSGSQLAKALQTSQQVISGYASGRTSPGREMIASIIDRYPAISATWLVTGIGDPFPAGRFNEKPAPAPRPEPAPDYTTAEGTGLAAVNIILKEQIADLRKQNQQLLDMLGKLPGSSDAAGYCAPTSPRPAAGFKLSVSNRVAGRGRAQMSR